MRQIPVKFQLCRLCNHFTQTIQVFKGKKYFIMCIRKLLNNVLSTLSVEWVLHQLMTFHLSI